MAEPYYQDGQVTLYLGDCREVTEWLVADVMVTDPPYGLGWTGYSYNDGPPHEGIANDGDTQARDHALELWGDRPAVIFGSPYRQFPRSYRHLLIWEKPRDTGMMGTSLGFKRDIEVIFLMGKPWPVKPCRAGSVIRSLAPSAVSYSMARYRNDRGTGHPHTKPLDVMEQLVDAAPPGVIADPFAGSGSTLVAARNLGRKAIGVEIEERYCEVAARRLSQMALDLTSA